MAVNTPFTIGAALLERSDGIRQIDVTRQPCGATHDRLMQIHAVVVAHHGFEQFTGHARYPHCCRKLYFWNADSRGEQPIECCDRVFIFYRPMADIVTDTEMAAQHGV